MRFLFDYSYSIGFTVTGKLGKYKGGIPATVVSVEI